MSFSSGGGSSQSFSASKPVLFGPDKLLTEQERRSRDVGGASILEDALKGGFSPQERSKQFARRADVVNRSFKTGLGDLSGITARSGLKGGAAVTDIRNLIGERIQGLGGAAGEVEQASLEQENLRKQRLLELLGIAPAALLGQASVSIDRGTDKSIDVGL